MKILFMGTPDFARIILEGLIESGESIVACVTQPDRPQGRHQVLTAPPVKRTAADAGIAVYQPETLKDGAFEKTLCEIAPDIIIVAAYGKILPEYILSYPRFGCICAHASLLPKYRGAAPIQRAIMNGDTVTGVTAMLMDAGIDTGDILLSEKIDILPDDNFEAVHEKLAAAGRKAIAAALERIKSGKAEYTEQDDDASSYAAKITKDDGRLDKSMTVQRAYNVIRALSPSPLAWYVGEDGKKIKILRAHKADFEPDGSLCIRFADGVIAVDELIPEGKGIMSADAYLRGRRTK